DQRFPNICAFCWMPDWCRPIKAGGNTATGFTPNGCSKCSAGCKPMSASGRIASTCWAAIWRKPMTSDAIVIDMFYRHPVRQVWEALTSSEGLAAWLMPNDFEPRLGHRFTFQTSPDQQWSGIVQCQVVALEELKRIAYTWQSGPIDTLVTFSI